MNIASKLENTNFPEDTACEICNAFDINEDNIQEYKEFIYYIATLSHSGVSDLINEIFNYLNL